MDEKLEDHDVLQGLRGNLLSQGAEARVFETTFLGARAVVKQRFKKQYRHPTLDLKLTSRRLNQEARGMVKALRLGVSAPILYTTDAVSGCLVMQHVEGRSVKEVLLASKLGVQDPEVVAVANQMGAAIARCHDGSLVHGDLTTSNMLQASDSRLVLIDFGLSSTSTLSEDKAVDLYVLERALISLHSKQGDVFSLVLAAYRQHSKNWCPTLNKLAAVRLRGRKRVMVG